MSCVMTGFASAMDVLTIAIWRRDILSGLGEGLNIVHTQMRPVFSDCVFRSTPLCVHDYIYILRNFLLCK